jgi:hypothetical protein
MSGRPACPEEDGPAVNDDADVDGPVIDTDGVIEGFEPIIIGLTADPLADVTRDERGVEKEPMESDIMVRSLLSLGRGYRTSDE